jgi:GGDEF domain-containing protein
MKVGPPRRRRQRPVADAPVEALLGRVEDLAKGWLLTLLEQAPLDDAPAILASDLIHVGPQVCAAVVRALADERELGRIDAGGELEPLVARIGELAGASRPADVSRASEALRAVIWSALREEIAYPDPDQLSELAERLALVVELVRDAALRRCEGVGGRDGAAAEAAAAPGRGGTAVDVRGPGDAADARAAQPEPLAAPEADGSPAPVMSPDSEALWHGALEDEIAQARHFGTPVALLLVELGDANRVLAVEPAASASATFGRFAQAVRRGLRRQDILACETESRAWVIARDTGRTAAQALGSRVVRAVRETDPWRGAPLIASVGVAILGEDGDDSASLMAAAEEATFSAMARGIGVAPPLPPDAPDPEPGPAGGPTGPRLAS